MTPAPAQAVAMTGSWLARTEAWLDARGRGAWIAVMVLGFIFFWPIGLALLAYMIWSKRMFANRNAMTCGARRARHASAAFRSSGNAAFDAYKADMLRRLEDEQSAFEEFLERLREAKDKAEFDQFMEDRSKREAPKSDDA
ncbi:DUF2852 domain-containing protein [Jannaschia ovalis]|uniref:DUF2852 domain-containing protein n=1 Tax=Jannaschia ovalis TaxID=3038773 RepID=A0ABY8LB07_9RHOB|nr:DUF2852 domain-containing protein [Jannaschia sp. GRR-S6-38]WGH78519.1 DUF2852 domain-containing protein [Jannaschia sp. GRR-S6-38]